MFNLYEIKQARTKRNLEQSDIKDLRDLQLLVYREYLKFYMRKSDRERQEDYSLSSVSARQYLEKRLEEIEKEGGAGKEYLKEQLRNTIDAACVFVTGRKPCYEPTYANGMWLSEDSIEDIMESALVKTALSLPVKRKMFVSSKELRKANGFDFCIIQSDISISRNIYSFTNKILDERFIKMHEQNYNAIRKDKAPLYSEFEFDLVEYQGYIVSRQLAKLIKIENQIENRRLRKMRSPEFFKTMQGGVHEFVKKTYVPKNPEESNTEEKDK